MFFSRHAENSEPAPTAAAPRVEEKPLRAETHADISALGEEIRDRSEPFRRLRAEIGRVIVGQEELIERMILALLADGHLLIEGVPGLAKTTAVASLAAAVQLQFQRLQFTPDLLPADLIGTQIYRPQHQDFTVQKGPVFANLVLADEINRAPAKVQSALLEAMQERQVTIGPETFPLPQPFLVMATQNPIEQEGTYPLPEAQLDRFLMKVVLRHPTREQEIAILERMTRLRRPGTVEAVLSPAAILEARELIDRIYLDTRVRDYIVDLVLATREPHVYGTDLNVLLQFGASPRGTIGLTVAAKARAFLEGRGYVTPDDVKSLALDVLRHRVILSYEAEAEEQSPDDVLRMILERVPVP